MKGYYERVCTEIYNGLLGTITTDKKGQLSLDDALDVWADHAKKTQDDGGEIFFCGNGASATMAEHMSHDWFQNGLVRTATCSETSHITAISNDISFEDVFSYRIDRTLSDKDILVTISSSGNSPNILKAIDAAKKKGAFVITLSGKSSDNRSRSMGDLNFYVPLPTYGLVEAAHTQVLHIALDYFMDKYLEGRH